MRCRDIRRFIAPDCPRSERELEEKQNDPPDRQSPKCGHMARVFHNTNTKGDHSDPNQNREKTVRQLQPDLNCIHIRKSACVTPGIDLCQRRRARVRNPRAIRGRKIEDRQIFVLMAHGRAKRQLQVDRDRDHGLLENACQRIPR